MGSRQQGRGSIGAPGIERKLQRCGTMPDVWGQQFWAVAGGRRSGALGNQTLSPGSGSGGLAPPCGNLAHQASMMPRTSSGRSVRGQ